MRGQPLTPPIVVEQGRVARLDQDGADGVAGQAKRPCALGDLLPEGGVDARPVPRWAPQHDQALHREVEAGREFVLAELTPFTSALSALTRRRVRFGGRSRAWPTRNQERARWAISAPVSVQPRSPVRGEGARVLHRRAPSEPRASSVQVGRASAYVAWLFHEPATVCPTGSPPSAPRLGLLESLKDLIDDDLHALAAAFRDLRLAHPGLAGGLLAG